MAKPKKEEKWYRFGRSGDTVDGRIIKEQDILDAVETFNSGFYPTMIWPDHKRWFNLGKVIAIRAEKNDEGGTDMYGQVEANEYYKEMNKNGQRRFFSMELWPDFRKSGKTYLSGLGATDEPASVATSEIHLSRVEKEVIVGETVEQVPHYFDAQEGDAKTLLAAIAHFFKSQTQPNDDSDDSQEETDMTKEQYEALQKQVTGLVELFTKKFPDEPKPDGKTEDATLEEQVVFLTKQVKDLTEKLGSGDKTPSKDEPKDGPSKEEFAQLQTKINDLTKVVELATQEQQGTNGGEHDGDGKDLSACI